MRGLGLHAPPPDAVRPGMPVHGLIALARYNPRSKLLERAIATARSTRGPQWLVHLDERSRLSGRERWTVLAAA
jgi:hypothetical protein